MKSGSLNSLEPSGPVQACNRIALPYLFCVCIVYVQTQAVDKKWGCLTMVHTGKHLEYRPVKCSPD